jgi:hypothetical protein
MRQARSAWDRLVPWGFAVAALAAPSASAAREPSRFAIVVEGGTAWESHDPQSFLLADPSGREPQLEFDSGSTYGVALDVQLAPVLVLRTSYEVSDADLSITLFPPEGLPDGAVVARTTSEALRVGVFFHGLMRRDLFASDAEHRIMGRFGASVARASLRSIEVPQDVREAFEIVSVSSADSWTFALEAEFIARFGRSRWFGGVGVLVGVGPGPEVVLEPSAGTTYVESAFEYRSNRLTARLGYRF